MLSNPIRVAAMAAALSLVGLASADGTVQTVSVEKSGSGVAVHIKGKDLAQPTKVWAKKGNSLVLEFSGTLAGKQAYTQVHKAGLDSIYVQERETQKTVRVYLALDYHVEPTFVKTDDGWDVTFGKAGAPVAKAAPKAKPAAKSGGTVEPAVPPLEPASVVMDRMHGDPAQDVRGPRVDNASPRVSLDFVNTEVVQILKALAMQTGVNIVTAPDVKGTLTVTLDNVSVKDALDMVTSVSGLRYANVGNSYIVATPDKIASASAALSGNHAMLMETRIVPIYSGAGREIRASIMSSMTDPDTINSFSIYLPSEEFSIKKSANSPTTGAAGNAQDPLAISTTAKKNADGAAADVNGGSDKEQVSVEAMKEQYLVLVGPSDKIGEVEDRIKELDHSISKAYGYEDTDDTRLVRDTYMLKSDDVKASDLVKAIAATQPNNFLNVDMYATPGTFKNQSVVIVGRENEVKKAEGLLKDLDQSGYGDEVFMYDVKHADPRALREDLVAQIKGLRVSIPPASAGNINVYQEGQDVQQAAQTTSAASSGDSKQQAAGTSSIVNIHDEKDNEYGLASPFKDFEKEAVPMKLMLTGTHDEIDEAKSYLEKVDVAAKQVALELRVMELTKEQALNVGLDWNVMTGSAAVTNLNAGGGGVSKHDGLYSIVTHGKKWAASVTATLDQISNRNNLIARPNILALDGRESELFVGDVIRYISSIQSTQNGVTVTTAEIPVGVRLSVMPRVGDTDMTLDLRPSVSVLKSFTPIPGGGELPQTSLRTAQETVSLHDGDTIAIGGLIQDSDSIDVTKVPILGDLPIIGELFKKTNKDRQRIEVVLFLTAKIVNDQADSAADPRVSAAQHAPEIDTPPKP